MEGKLINIGNSKGIIIPPKFLKLIGLKERLSINIENGRITISPVGKKVREGWAEILKQEMKKDATPKQLVPDLFFDEDDDWTWEG